MGTELCVILEEALKPQPFIKNRLMVVKEGQGLGKDGIGGWG